mgnify:CR=1 FL=1
MPERALDAAPAQDAPQPEVRAFVYDALWGMPSGGPFSLKLLTWLRMAGIEHAITVDNDARNGPKQKNPWVAIDGELVGDTEIIAWRLSERLGIDLDASLSARERAVALAFRRLIDEHLHQVVTHTHFVSDRGWSVHGQAIVGTIEAPGFLKGFIGSMIRRGITKAAWVRGMSRHDDATIDRMGSDDLRALSAQLGEAPFLMGEQPTTVDASFYAFLAFVLQVPIDGPMRQLAQATPNLVAYHQRMTERFFPELAS